MNYRKEKQIMKATNILWDTDGDYELLQELPRTIQIPEGMTDEDKISDYLSDQTGFCHNGYCLVEDNGKYANNQTTMFGITADELNENHKQLEEQGEIKNANNKY